MIAERLKILIESEKISVRAFETKIGCSNGVIARCISKQTDIQSVWLNKIIEAYPDINAYWLITGKGDMYINKCRNNSTNTIDLSSIPVVDISLAAGYGCHNNTYLGIQDTIQLPSSMITPGKTYYCARVKGQSMIPTLQDDSYLILRLLDRSEWPYMRDNYIYAVSDRDGMAYIKRIKNRFREHGFITLMSDNLDKANYPNFNLHEDEIQTILYAEWYLSAKMPNINDTYYKKLNDLENTVNDIKDMLLNERKGQ